MVSYSELQKRLDGGDVVILDGAIGTELQRMGVPMDYHAWSALVMDSHADTVRQLHEDYIRAGADVITTNTYTAARHILDQGGFGDRTPALNAEAVRLAVEARERVEVDRPVYIAGSVSLLGTGYGRSIEDLTASCTEQATLLAEAGSDFLLLEMLATNVDKVLAAIEVAREVGLPFWTSITCIVQEEGGQVLYGERESPSQQGEIVDGITFAEAVERIGSADGSAALLVFHSQVESTGHALADMKSGWSGTTGAYANSGYWVQPNWQYVEMISPEGYLNAAREWVGAGAQIIGGCCGVGIQHVELLRDGLPKSV